MFRRFFLAVVLVGAAGVWSLSPLQGQQNSTIESNIGGQNVKLTLTGAAVRSVITLKIYTIASYIEAGVKIRTPAEMVAADCPKQLHLRMLRRVTGKNIAESFRSLLRSNHPEPEFNEEVNAIVAILRSQAVHNGDEIWFTHIPKVGFQCQIAGGAKHLVRNVAFSKAIWENYFGKHNVGENVKEALLSRLPS